MSPSCLPQCGRAGRSRRDLLTAVSAVSMVTAAVAVLLGVVRLMVDGMRVTDVRVVAVVDCAEGNSACARQSDRSNRTLHRGGATEQDMRLRRETVHKKPRSAWA